MENSRVLFVLYGNQNQGKSTTLRLLASLLAGGENYQSLLATIKQVLKSKKNWYKDTCFILKYQKKSVYIATGGDSWVICRKNCEFFDGNFHSQLNIYEISSNGIRLLSTDDKLPYKGNAADICITACRPKGDGTGAGKAVQTYCEKRFDDFNYQIWIRKYSDKANKSDDIALEKQDKECADKIKKMIDDFVNHNM